MTQEALKKMYQLLLTEPHAETVCFKLEAIAREALAQPPLPVQPERQPLTDEQIQKIWDVAAGALPGWSRHITYARAIEAAHNIKEPSNEQ